LSGRKMRPASILSAVTAVTAGSVIPALTRMNPCVPSARPGRMWRSPKQRLRPRNVIWMTRRRSKPSGVESYRAKSSPVRSVADRRVRVSSVRAVEPICGQRNARTVGLRLLRGFASAASAARSFPRNDLTRVGKLLDYRVKAPDFLVRDCFISLYREFLKSRCFKRV